MRSARPTTIEMTTTTTSTVDITPRVVAEIFAAMTDEQQAQVFIEMAKIATAWEGTGSQWWSVGRHLKNCECSTWEARELVREIAAAAGND